MEEIKVAADQVLAVPAGVEYKAPHMADWVEARPGLLSVHAGDLLRAKTPEAKAAIAQISDEPRTATTAVRATEEVS